MRDVNYRDMIINCLRKKEHQNSLSYKTEKLFSFKIYEFTKKKEKNYLK